MSAKVKRFFIGVSIVILTFFSLWLIVPNAKQVEFAGDDLIWAIVKEIGGVIILAVLFQCCSVITRKRELRTAWGYFVSASLVFFILSYAKDFTPFFTAVSIVGIGSYSITMLKKYVKVIYQSLESGK